MDKQLKRFLDNIAKNIRKYRKQRGLTQIQLSTLAGLDRKYLSKMENGLTNPSIRTLYKLSKALGTSLNNFLI